MTFLCIFKGQAREPSWVLGEEVAKRLRVPALPKPYSGGELSRLEDLLKRVTPRNLHRELDFGQPVDREAL
ncbi:MAG: hypothetical protein HOP22_13500 [Nitrospiraceae bacterium]|nr:hypothetical protein [Nitrospiraceae bacterium]